MSGPFGSNQLFGVAAADDAYTIDNSCMFDGVADYLTRTWTASGNLTTYTVSFWMKRWAITTAEQKVCMARTIGGSNTTICSFAASADAWVMADEGSGTPDVTTTALYRDVSAWYHFVFVWDTGNDTSSERIRLYVNGLRITSFSAANYPSADQDSIAWNVDTVVHRWAAHALAGGPYSLSSVYLAECIMLDGTAGTAATFGEFNSDGVWIPTDPSSLTFGSEGFWLDFEDSSDLGKDVSGNGNDWTSVSMSASNQTLDSPTDSGTTIGNLAVWASNCNNRAAWTGSPSYLFSYSEGSRKVTAPSSVTAFTFATVGYNSDKVAFEITCNTTPASSSMGILTTQALGVAGDEPGSHSGEYGYRNDGQKRSDGSPATYGDAWSDGDIVRVEHDVSGGTIEYFLNDVSQGDAFTGVSATEGPWVFYYGGYNSEAVTLTRTDTPTTGFSYIGTQNLPAPTITKPTDNFLPIVYEGNGAGQRVGNFIPFTDTFAVDNSCMFKGESSQYFSLAKGNLTTPTGGTTNGNQKFTLSYWLKLVKNNNNASDGNGSVVYGTSVDSGGGALQLQWSWNSTQGPAFNWTDWSDESGGAGNWLRRVLGNATTTAGPQGGKVNYDFSNWHHYVIAADWTSGGGLAGTDACAEVYIDGQLQTLFLYDGTELVKTNPADTNYSGMMSDIADQNLGFYPAGTRYGHFYLAEVIGVDGQKLAPSVFGQTDTSTNRWIPKDPTSTLASASDFGNNGFYLDMASANDLGNDVSGNNNDWTMNNMDTTNGSNQMYDTPSQNFCTWNPEWKDSEAVLTEGNLKAVGESTGSPDRIDSTMFFPSTGKYYYEARVDAVDGTYPATGGGIFSSNFNTHPSQAGLGGFVILNNTTAKVYVFNHVETASYTGTTLAAGDVIGVAINMDTGKFWFSYNGTFLGSGDPEAGTNESGSIPAGMSTVMPSLSGYNGAGVTGNFGQWRYFDGATTTLDSDAGGYFQSTSVPSGFKALQQDNLPANTAGITGFSWIKNRDASDPHILQNSVEGIYNYMSSNDHLQQITNTNSVQRFLQQGVQIGNMDAVNTSAESFVLWQWANDGGAGSVNGDGDTDITLAVNSTAGFSYGLATSPSSGGFTVGHGLGVQPSFVIQKNTNADNGWNCWHKDLTNETSYWVDLYDDGAEDSSTVIWNNTAPTTSVMSANADWYSASRIGLWMFFAQVEGYSSFGSYTGNGSGSYAVDYDGPFIYTGFKPAFVLIKRIDSTGNWVIFDDKRSPINPRALQLHPNLTNVDGAGNDQDFLANGWKVRSNGSDVNASGGDYIYAAFAENPFGGSGVAQAKAV